MKEILEKYGFTKLNDRWFLKRDKETPYLIINEPYNNSRFYCDDDIEITTEQDLIDLLDKLGLLEVK